MVTALQGYRIPDQRQLWDTHDSCPQAVAEARWSGGTGSLYRRGAATKERKQSARTGPHKATGALASQLRKTGVGKGPPIYDPSNLQEYEVIEIKKRLLRSYSGISGGTKKRKRDSCHQEAHGSLRGQARPTEQAASVAAGSAAENVGTEEP